MHGDLLHLSHQSFYTTLWDSTSIGIGETLPTEVALTGYTSIGTSEDTPINAQTPTLTGLPTEEGITYTYSINPEIPASLILNPTTGELSGTPTTPQAATVYTITATLQGRYIGTVDTTISIEITGDVPEEIELTGYSKIQILKDTTIADQSPEPSNLPVGGITFTYSISPAIQGLTIDSTTGVLSGSPTTPQEPGDYTITATAQGHYIGSKEVTISITVYKVQATDKAHLSTLIDTELQDAAGGNVNLIDTSLVTDMFELFRDKTTFNEDISAWDVSNVTNMTSMFFDATSFNQNLNDWDVSNVGSMENMFYGATSFNQDLNNWDVSNVVYMGSMFQNATSFNGDISNWTTTVLSESHGMFYGATSFNIDISQWTLPKIGLLGAMFQNATSFNQDLNPWGQYIPDNPGTIRNMFKDSGVENLPSWYTE